MIRKNVALILKITEFHSLTDFENTGKIFLPLEIFLCSLFIHIFHYGRFSEGIGVEESSFFQYILITPNDGLNLTSNKYLRKFFLYSGIVKGSVRPRLISFLKIKR